MQSPILIINQYFYDHYLSYILYLNSFGPDLGHYIEKQNVYEMGIILGIGVHEMGIKRVDKMGINEMGSHRFDVC